MSKFTEGKWEFDTELYFVKNKKGDEIAELFWDTDDGDKEERLQANGRLMKMYNWLKTIAGVFDEGNIINVSGIKELLARIDGEE